MADFEHYQNLEARTEDVADNLEAELATIPEKFKGKSIKDVAQAYAELESAMSRQGQELGEYRRLATSLLEVEPKKDAPKEVPADISADELLADPTKALERAIEQNPSVKQVIDRSRQLEQQLAQRTFMAEYPEFQKDLANDKFHEWVKKNPVRTNLIQAANAYDVNAARALWSMWSEHNELVGASTAKVTEAAQRKQQEKDAVLEGSSGSDASTEVTFSRADLRELHRKALLGDRAAKAKWEDPKFKIARLKAYAEERAK